MDPIIFGDQLADGSEIKCIAALLQPPYAGSAILIEFISPKDGMPRRVRFEAPFVIGNASLLEDAIAQYLTERLCDMAKPDALLVALKNR